uniref:Uncharacterized protein n=1 Tax=Aegilops tauschii TaxID=37682 RepID=N1QYJ4_AEGTA
MTVCHYVNGGEGGRVNGKEQEEHNKAREEEEHHKIIFFDTAKEYDIQAVEVAHNIGLETETFVKPSLCETRSKAAKKLLNLTRIKGTEKRKMILQVSNNYRNKAATLAFLEDPLKKHGKSNQLMFVLKKHSLILLRVAYSN